MEAAAAGSARLQQEKAAGDAEWEARLREAVDSAEKWKGFAEQLGGEKTSLSESIADLQQQLQVQANNFPVEGSYTVYCARSWFCQSEITAHTLAGQFRQPIKTWIFCSSANNGGGLQLNCRTCHAMVMLGPGLS